MKHKLTAILFATLICALCVFGFTACKRCKHEYGEWTVITAATCESAGEQSRTCTKCGRVKKESIAALGHDMQAVNAKAATCESEGWKAYEQCSRCDHNTKQVIAALGHEFSENWATDGEKHWHVCTHEGCEAKSNEGKHSEVAHNCSVCGLKTSEHEFSENWTTDADKHWHVCTYEGCEEKSEESARCEVNHYCSVCNYKTSEHKYGEVTYNWSDYYDACKAVRVCSNCGESTEGHMQTATAVINSTVKAADCVNPELTTYTATFAEDWAITQTVENVQTKDALNHDYGEVTYTWSDENKKVTATRVCKNDGSHVETETVASGDDNCEKNITQEKTCLLDEISTLALLARLLESGVGCSSS